MAPDEKRCSRVGKVLRSMLSKEVSTPETHRLTTWKSSHPFSQVALDIIGPLPESSGNKQILLIGDQFTKWYEAIPMSNQEASMVAKASVNVWLAMTVAHLDHNMK